MQNPSVGLVGFVLVTGTLGASVRQCETQKLIASDASQDDSFGNSVAVDGEVAVVGAHRDDCANGNPDCGSAYVYRWNGSLWLQEQRLSASDATLGDQFGFSVALSGDTALIGAYGAACANGNPDCGAAYVFRWTGTSWQEEQKLAASDQSLGDSFGYSVALSGNDGLVGANADTTGPFFAAGSAYAFHWDGTMWVQAQKLTASDQAGGDQFGLSVSLKDDVGVVGAYLDDCAGGFDCGAAYVFRKNGSAWLQEQKLSATDPAGGDFFGYSVFTDGHAIAIGATGDNCTALSSNCGSAYVFRWNGAAWLEEQRLTASDQAEGDDYGASVGISGEVTLVGASGDACAMGGGLNCGSVYLYRFQGSTWVEEQSLQATDQAGADRLGISVSLGKQDALVGAFGDACPGGLSQCGSAYVFSVSNATDCNQNGISDTCDSFVCNDSNPCTTDSCNATACTFLENVLSCDDGNPCTRDDACNGGSCSGQAYCRLYGDHPDSAVCPVHLNLCVVDVDDVCCVLQAFTGGSSLCPTADHYPCGPDACSSDEDCVQSVTGPRCLEGGCRCMSDSDCAALNADCIPAQGGRCDLVDVEDLLAELDAFTGAYLCPHPCPP